MNATGAKRKVVLRSLKKEDNSLALDLKSTRRR